ncbi:MAG: glucans biosynthesis glucosyltransferase MdoH [Proteobacteria bacterium]|nr:glucans biosynthesis glucosyltransferase MdoH [Pseudomonadota bacterium]
MDAVTTQHPRHPPVTHPAMPAESPLAMPTQSFRSWSAKEKRTLVNAAAAATPTLIRLWVFGGGLLITAYGAYEMYRVVNAGTGITFLQWLLVILFVANFIWIALAFTGAVAGFFSLLFNRPRSMVRPATLSGRTAVVMPIYNEAPSRVFAAMQTMAEGVSASGLGSHFDFFFLSDTTDPDAWIAEERAYFALREKFPHDIRLFYRHRIKNTGRKAGNIADFVTRWGGAYDHMLVLDADSLVEGDTIVGLAGAMEADPDSGIIQTLPLIINRNTLFARLQQFAARVYGPVIAEGLRLWMGRDGNYWGHNAIIRTKAFADHCGMPELSGKPPFGGHIMSHDFVEAALIRRAGWSVTMIPGLVGSYEESPPSLIDLTARDRRWCQGNLQHTRVIGAKGFRWATRHHFLTGIVSYLASPLWLAQLVVGIMLVIQAYLIRPEYFTSEFSLFPAWPRFDAERALNLFLVTMGILLAPKLFGWLLALLRSDERRAYGGAIRLTLSAIFETIMSALIAPIMMVIQSGAVFQILFGGDTGWKPQRRDDGTMPLSDIVRRHRGHVALGVFTGIVTYLISPSLFAWMSPTILGLLLAILISWWTALSSLGIALKHFGLLWTPEERSPPAIAERSNALQAHYGDFDMVDGVTALHDDEKLRDRHNDLLPHHIRRRRGEIDRDHVVAEAKIADAETIADAAAWLTTREKTIALQDRALVAMLAQLQHAPGHPK